MIATPATTACYYKSGTAYHGSEPFVELSNRSFNILKSLTLAPKIWNSLPEVAKNFFSKNYRTH